MEALNSNETPEIKCNSENGLSQAQAGSLCTAIKNAKIEVYTVGFEVSSAAKSFLASCATDASHYYDATTEVALEAAFRDIAKSTARFSHSVSLPRCCARAPSRGLGVLGLCR